MMGLSSKCIISILVVFGIALLFLVRLGCWTYCQSHEGAECRWWTGKKHKTVKHKRGGEEMIPSGKSQSEEGVDVGDGAGFEYNDDANQQYKKRRVKYNPKDPDPIRGRRWSLSNGYDGLGKSDPIHLMQGGQK